MLWAALPMKINKSNFHLHLWSPPHWVPPYHFLELFYQNVTEPERNVSFLLLISFFPVQIQGKSSVLCSVLTQISLAGWFQYVLDRMGYSVIPTPFVSISRAFPSQAQIIACWALRSKGTDTNHEKPGGNALNSVVDSLQRICGEHL